MALGQRVDSFAVSARRGGQWDLLEWGCSIGNKRILKLDETVFTNRLAIDIVRAKAPPMMANVEVYYVEEEE